MTSNILTTDAVKVWSAMNFYSVILSDSDNCSCLKWDLLELLIILWKALMLILSNYCIMQVSILTFYKPFLSHWNYSKEKSLVFKLSVIYSMEHIESYIIPAAYERITLGLFYVTGGLDFSFVLTTVFYFYWFFLKRNR